MSELDVTMLLVGDDPIVRAWVRLAIEGTELRLIGEAGSIQEARQLLGLRRPRVFLVDHRLLRRSRARLPRSGQQTPENAKLRRRQGNSLAPELQRVGQRVDRQSGSLGHEVRPATSNQHLETRHELDEG